MEKAYDTKVLIDQLKAKGLDLAEDAAVILLEEILVWFEESARLSENKYDDLLIAVLPLIKDQALEAIDKIDGKVG